MKNLLVTPTYESTEFVFVRLIGYFVDGVQRGKCTLPSKILSSSFVMQPFRFKKNNIYRNEIMNFANSSDNAKRVIENINYLRVRGINVDKFITEKTEKFYPKVIPAYAYDFYTKINYIIVREPLKTFISSLTPEIFEKLTGRGMRFEDWKEIKNNIDYICNNMEKQKIGSCKDFTEWTDKKTTQLLQEDILESMKSLNATVEKRRKKILERFE